MFSDFKFAIMVLSLSCDRSALQTVGQPCQPLAMLPGTLQLATQGSPGAPLALWHTGLTAFSVPLEAAGGLLVKTTLK